MACWLKHRLSVCIDDITAWTGGPLQSRSVAEVIRRLVRPRNLLANNRITYECVSSCTSPTMYAWVNTAPGGVCLENPEERIRICPRFWNPGHAKFREQDLIHEALSHSLRRGRGRRNQNHHRLARVPGTVCCIYQRKTAGS